MGQQIAELAVKADLKVGLFDLDQELANRVAQSLGAEAGADVHVYTSPDSIEASRYGLAIETIVEQAAAKQKLLTTLESVLTETCLLATNTSTLPIAMLSQPLRCRERLVGMHFLLPVSDRRLVEIVAGPEQQKQADEASAWVRRLDRLPLVVGDQTGFLVNRLLFPMLARGVQLWLEGTSPLKIDRAALDAGFGFGPFLAMDHIGLDTSVRAGAGFWQMFPKRSRPSPILPALVKRKRLGRKTNAGVLSYAKTSPGHSDANAQLEYLAELADSAAPLDAEVVSLVEQYGDKKCAGELPGESPVPIEVASELWSAVLSEAIRVTEEGYVSDPREVDVAWTFGLGLDRRLAPPMRWIRDHAPAIHRIDLNAKGMTREASNMDPLEKEIRSVLEVGEARQPDDLGADDLLSGMKRLLSTWEGNEEA